MWAGPINFVWAKNNINKNMGWPKKATWTLTGIVYSNVKNQCRTFVTSTSKRHKIWFKAHGFLCKLSHQTSVININL